MATQAEVDQLTQEAQQVRDNLATAKQNIEDRFAALEKAVEEGSKPVKEAIDLTGLKEAIGGLSTPSQELEDLQPVQATPEGTPPETAAPTQTDGTAVTDQQPPPSGQTPDPAPPTQPAGAADTSQEDAARTTV